MQIVHVPQVAADGVAVGFYSLATDITPIRRSRQALGNRDALYDSVVNQLPMALVQKDREGRITFVNSKFCEFTKMSSDAVIQLLAN